MSEHLKAALITVSVFVGIVIFISLCVVTDGLALVFLFIGFLYYVVYTVVLDMLRDRRRRRERAQARGGSDPRRYLS